MSYEQQIASIMEEWLVENNEDKVDADAASEWAVLTGRYQRKPISEKEMCKQDMLKVLQKARHTDPQGRKVKTRYSLKFVGEQRVLQVIYLDVRTAKPSEMHQSFTQHFDRLGNGVHRHATDVSSYNDNNIYRQQIPLFDYDMSNFVELHAESTEYDDDYDDSYDGNSGESNSNDAKSAGQS
jgi:hypothetical protein